MPELKLTYFDFHGGRAEPARLAMFIGGVAFEDERLSFDQFKQAKPNLPYGCVPTLEVDGTVVSQSNGINRYVGKLAELYPSDALQAALCDEVMDAVEDLTHKISPTFSIKDPAEKKAAREALADGPITFFLQQIQARLALRGGKYFADDRLTVADLKVFVWIRYLKSGTLDHIPTDLADRAAPLLVEHFERVKNHPKIREYYETR